jgi:hypothetical protein
LKDALTNVGKVISAANLQSLENVPGVLLFNLPTNSSPTRADGLTLSYGWFKRAPTITQVSGAKWELVQEWQYGLWSTDLYVFV